MPMKARVSTIESFRRVCETEFADEDELIASIRAGQNTPASCWQQEAGTAFHKTVELVAGGQLQAPAGECLVGFGNYLFSPSAVKEALMLQGAGMREVRREHSFFTTAGELVLSGQADHLRGLEIRDIKCKFSTPDAGDYEPSLQWRGYLVLHGCKKFTYDLFHFKDPDETGFCELKNVLSFSFWEYLEMRSELNQWCERFARWAVAKGLREDLEKYDRLPDQQPHGERPSG